ncbi:hypothetical protein F4777DRAFT_458601 [Nemania sp. FL0916]|nr:hypothetical protein F4777DRAFT_458601 [Nemania sp. FL0916]
MPIQETLEFKSDEFRQVVARAPTEWLRQQEVIATRKRVLSSVGVGVGVSGAVSTGGVSVLFAAYKSRSLYVADRKLELIQEELRKRNVELHKFSKTKDLLGPAAVGVAGAVIGAEVGDLFDGLTNIDQVAPGLPADALPSTGLFDDSGAAWNGAEGAIERLADSLTGEAGTAAAILPADAIAYHAGMVQVESVAQEIGQTVAEKLLFAPGEASPACRRALGVGNLSCDQCGDAIKQGFYWHCCVCNGDNYDICQRCYSNKARCNGSRHAMTRLQVPVGPAFIDKISAVPGYGIWKPKAGTSITMSELTRKSLFRCNFCQADVRQGQIFHCFECGSFDLCDECYLLGKRCGGGHTLVSALCAIDSINCPGYIRDFPGGRDTFSSTCSGCKKPARQGTFYRCYHCRDKSGSGLYNLCHSCYSTGSRCRQPNQHVLVLDLVSSDDFGAQFPSICVRRSRGITTQSLKKGGSCNRCNNYITSGTFFHCCRCPEDAHGTDNFDLCLQCYRAGRHCFNTSHMLTRHYIY